MTNRALSLAFLALAACDISARPAPVEACPLFYHAIELPEPVPPPDSPAPHPPALAAGVGLLCATLPEIEAAIEAYPSLAGSLDARGCPQDPEVLAAVQSPPLGVDRFEAVCGPVWNGTFEVVDGAERCCMAVRNLR